MMRDIDRSCGGCGAGPRECCGIECPRSPKPEHALGSKLVTAMETFADWMSTTPPFSWIDAILFGPVGPRK